MGSQGLKVYVCVGVCMCVWVCVCMCVCVCVLVRACTLSLLLVRLFVCLFALVFGFAKARSLAFPLDFFPVDKGCSWLTKNKNKANARKDRYCVKPEIVSACPATCSSACTNDASFEFTTYSTKVDVNCNWITKNKRQSDARRNMYCGEYGSNCVSACGRCAAV